MSDFAALQREAAQCTVCELYADATQTVFGLPWVSEELVAVGP
jgi:uracil-DNA glycosylase